MADSPLEMRFDPQTIKHLGLRMYATLPPALAEIISNAYDADAERVTIRLVEKNHKPDFIQIDDDGVGLSLKEINEKFLVIGRNRRANEGDKPSTRFGRLATGKKGLGKLALFGLANTITIRTRQAGMENEFVLDWEELNAAKGAYRPRATKVDAPTTAPDGTTIILGGLKRKSAFDAEALADSLSRIFLFGKSFSLVVATPAGDMIAVDNKRRYKTLNEEFSWKIDGPPFVPKGSPYDGKLSGELLTSEKPIAPVSGLRGITLFSRGKLVNAPEFFSSSTSSHFYQYLTGWLTIDFIDTLEEDVISTNRQSLDWDNPDMARLREFLAGIVSQVNVDWRKKRKDKKDKELRDKTGIDTAAWINTMPLDIKDSAQQIIEALGGEDALEKFTPIIKALHDIVPEYPMLHWRHLHKHVKDRVGKYYVNQQYGEAASEGVKIYCEVIRKLTGRIDDGTDLVNNVFGSKPFGKPPGKGTPAQLQLNALANDSEQCIQEGQGHLSRGVVMGFRNPISHAPIDSTVPAIFSELDCLNVLSLVSYLLTRLDSATVNPIASATMAPAASTTAASAPKP